MTIVLKNSDQVVFRAQESFRFRPDIQLLRAVAVIFVVAYHLGLPGFGNGFLGVDMFFVISGFLMEKLYRHEHRALDFYVRRAKRLLPPYFVTIWITAIAVVLFLQPDAAGRTSTQLQASAIFSSNFLHWSEESYFTNAYFSPLLHLWSLALEMQFYLFFPLLAFYTRRAWWSLPLIAAVALLACFLIVTVSPKTSFFMMPLRLWEFAIGMCVARFVFPNPGKLVVALAAIFLVGLLAAPVSGTAQSIIYGHPGVIAFFCSLLVATIIAFGIPQRVIPPGLVGLGNVSYSLYLVHFPIIAIYFYTPFSGTILGSGYTIDAIICLAMMIPATAALYVFVERKADKFFSWRNALLAIMGTLGFAVLMTPASERMAPPFVARLSQSLVDREEARCGKLYRFTHWDEMSCLYGERQAPAIYLLGDSHSEMITREVRSIAESQNLSVIMPKNRNDFLKTADWHRQVMKEHKVSGVLITWRDHETDLNRIADLVRELAVDYRVSVLLPQVELPAPGPLIALRSWMEGQNVAVIDAKPYRERLRYIAGFFLDIENVQIYDPSDLCAQTCALNSPNGTAYFFDSNHLTLSGAMRLRPILSQAIKRDD